MLMHVVVPGRKVWQHARLFLIDPKRSGNSELRLADTGYDDGEEYGRACFHVSNTRYFHVREDFLRLVRTAVPEAVHKVSYAVDLSYCARCEAEL